MKAITKRRFLQVVLVLGCVLPVAWFAVPRPIEGCWLGLGGPLDGEHQFYRFSQGRVYFYDPLQAPKYFGSYRRIGWNTYVWGEDVVSMFPGKVVKADIVRVGWVRSCLPNPKDEPKHWPKIYRDWRVFDVSRVMRLSQEKAQPVGGANGALGAPRSSP